MKPIVPKSGQTHQDTSPVKITPEMQTAVEVFSGKLAKARGRAALDLVPVLKQGRFKRYYGLVDAWLAGLLPYLVHQDNRSHDSRRSRIPAIINAVK